MTPEARSSSGERADFLATLAQIRARIRYTTRDISDDQARARTTVSELCLGGVIKHVALVEGRWASFITDGASAIGPMDEASMAAHAASFRMSEGETLASVLETYEDVALRTDELLASLPSLDESYPLPEAPWFEPGASWSARRVLLHIIEETAQHAGHADIIREALDGAKTMG